MRLASRDIAAKPATRWVLLIGLLLVVIVAGLVLRARAQKGVDGEEASASSSEQVASASSRASGDAMRSDEPSRGDPVQVRRSGVRVEGIVEDATGGTIEGAWVRVEDGTGAAVAAGVSGADGEFELWANQGHVVIEAGADGYVNGREALVVPSGPVRLVLLPEAVIAGRVLDGRTKAPIPDALVLARRSDDDRRAGTDDAVVRARSDEQGRYELRGLPGGVFGLSSQGPWGEGASEGGVVVEFGSRTEGVDILIHRGTTVRARVLITDTKQGCPGAVVSLVDEDVGRRLSGTTDDDGRVELSVAVAGSYRVDVRCEGYRLVGEPPIVALSGAPSESESLELMVDRGLVLRGRVLGEDQPLAAAAVALIPARGGPPVATAIADANGEVELAGLDEGEYVVTGAAPGWFPEELEARVTLPRDESFVLTLRAGGSLRGSIVEPNGQPVASARVLAHRRSANGRWRGETLSDARRDATSSPRCRPAATKSTCSMRVGKRSPPPRAKPRRRARASPRARRPSWTSSSPRATG